MAGDFFQERLDRELRAMLNIQNSADGELVDGKGEVTHDKNIIILLGTPRANNITFNCDKFVFKSKDLKFFGGNLTLEWYNSNPNKSQAITKIKPPQNLQEL